MICVYVKALGKGDRKDDLEEEVEEEGAYM